MLIKFFRNGKGAGSGPVGYLVADKVLAYDDNRDLIRDCRRRPTPCPRRDSRRDQSPRLYRCGRT